MLEISTGDISRLQQKNPAAVELNANGDITGVALPFKAEQTTAINGIRQLSPNKHATLVLDSKGGVALPIIGWKDAITLVCLGRVRVVEWSNRYAEGTFSEGVHHCFRLPEIVQAKKDDNTEGPAACTRFNITLRDAYQCQYTGIQFDDPEVVDVFPTFDHVTPKSYGGPWSWDNIVLATSKVNWEKRDRTPEEAEMTLLRQPWVPEKRELAFILAQKERQTGKLPASWNHYLQRMRPTDRLKRMMDGGFLSAA